MLFSKKNKPIIQVALKDPPKEHNNVIEIIWFMGNMVMKFMFQFNAFTEKVWAIFGCSAILSLLTVLKPLDMAAQVPEIKGARRTD